MERSLVTEGELIEILNSELEKHDNSGRYCFMPGVYRLAELDETGCNWSTPRLRASGVPMGPMAAIAERITAEAKMKYNLR